MQRRPQGAQQVLDDHDTSISQDVTLPRPLTPDVTLEHLMRIDHEVLATSIVRLYSSHLRVGTTL